MSDEIKKIDSIKNMAVFQDFRWASSLRDGGNNIAECKKINMLYGRNYSEKERIPNLLKIKNLEKFEVNEEPAEESKTAVEAQ